MTDDQNERASPHTPLGAALIYAQKRIEALEAENAALKAIQADEGEMLTIAWMDGAHRAKQNHRERITALEAENARLREALVAEREENLWSAYATGDVCGDQWTHLFMSDGEWLVRECGFDPKQGYYPAEEIRKAIPIAARAALGASHE